jgi:hypothetical protein
MSDREIEYANIMTPDELNQYLAYFINRNKKNKTKASEFLESVEQEVINSYYKHEETCVKTYNDRAKALTHEIKCWKEKKCTLCDSKLRKVTGEFGQFWGCPNFRDGRSHTRFSLDHDVMFSHKESYTKIKIGVHWATDLLRNLNYPEFIKASDLLSFFEKCGLQDLRLKYEGKVSLQGISSYPQAKAASRKEEKEIIETLRPLFEKNAPQLGIKYKLRGDKEQVAIIDLIASNSNLVFVFEIKRGPIDIDEDQLLLYHQLVTFTLKQVGDSRPCFGTFIVYNPELFISSSWLKTPFALYPNIQALISNSNKVIDYLKNHAFISHL